MADPHSSRFYAYACSEGRCHARLIPQAEGHQDAALSFLAHWSGESEPQVAVTVWDAATGEEQRFWLPTE
jgi:hypothetical protein